MEKNFFLTGSSRGLGRAIATSILDAGNNLIATARKPDQLAELVERYGSRILPVPLDVTDFEAAKRAVAMGIDTFGGIDVVVNNAGFAIVGSVEDMKVSQIASQFETNFLGSVHVIKAVLPHMREQGAGRIIQISSVGARIATPGAAGYYASKWALAGFLESLALELQPLGIRVTVMEPGGMRTEFAEDTSLTIVPSSPAYDATSGATARLMKSPGYGDRYTEPKSMANLVIKIAELDEPPLRLLAGGDAYAYAATFDEARTQADHRWKWLSLLADDPAENSSGLNRQANER